MSAELRFNYQGSYSDPTKHHFGWGDWLTEAECREAVGRALRNPNIVTESLQVIVQKKMSRWLRHKSGTVNEIFPDLIATFERDQAIAAALADKTLPPLVRFEAESAVRNGTVKETLTKADTLAATLRKVLAIQAG